MIPKPIQKYIFYIILFILVIGIVFISTKYIIQRFFPKIEGFDVPDGPGLTTYSNTTLTLAPGITRFLTGGLTWTSTLNGIVHTYYGTPLTDTIKNDINYYEPFINYFYSIATENGTDSEKIPKLVLTNGGTNAGNWYVSSPTYGKITPTQLRRISGPIADRIVRVMYLMIKGEIIRIEQGTFTNYPQNSPLIVGTYDAQYGGKNCMASNGTLCSGAKVYSGFSDYIRDGDNGALRHWRADFVQTKLPPDWFTNKTKMLALKTYAKLYDENPDFASNYLAHTPEIEDYAKGAGMTVGMLVGGNLAATILFNILYREVIEEIYDEAGVLVGKRMGARGVIPGLKGAFGSLKRVFTPGGGGARQLLTELGQALVSRVSTQTAKLKQITTLLRSMRAGEEALKDAAIVSKHGKLGLRMLAGAGRAVTVLKELSMIALGFDRSIKTVKLVIVGANATKLALKTAEAAAIMVQTATAATTSLAALAGGVTTALASNPVGWGIAIVMALADIILMIIDLVPKAQFEALGVKDAEMIISDHMLRCPVGTMDGASLSDEEFSSVYDYLPLPANLGVKDIAMKKRLSCMYTDVLGNNVMSQKVQCPEGNTETCFAEAPFPISIWPVMPDPVSRLTVLDLLDKIEDEIDNLSSDYIRITGYEWAAVTAVNTMKSKLAARASDFSSSYIAAVNACNLVQYNKIWASRGGTGPAKYGTEWAKDGRLSYNAWWSDISGAVQSTTVANVNGLTTATNPDTFATRMLKNPFNWGDRLRHAPRFHNVVDIACVSSGSYPNMNITASSFLSKAKDDSYNDAISQPPGAEILKTPANTRYLCQPMDFYRTIRGVMIKALLRKELETMKAEMDRYPDLIGKFAEDENLGDTPLSKILAAAATTAATAATEDAAAGRSTPSTTAARDAAVAAAITGYSTALNAFYPVNISYTTLSSFSSKINTAVWLTKIANESVTTAVGGIYDVSNTLILTAGGTTFEELDTHPSYISKFSTDVSGAYWNKKNFINADASTRQAKANAAWTDIRTSFSTPNDPYAMSTIQWLLVNTVPARTDPSLTVSEKAAVAKKSSDALIPFQNTPSAPINTILNNIIAQLASTNKSAAVTSSTDFLNKYNAFVSEMSYRNDDLEKDKFAAYITSITADAARIGYAAWKSKYMKTAIEMDALSTAKSIIYAYQTDGKKAAVIKSVTDTRATFIDELINYNKYTDTRDYYINACNTPGWTNPFIDETDPSFRAGFVQGITFGAVSAVKERYDGTRRSKVYGIPIMEKANPWFLTPMGAQRAINAMNSGTTTLSAIIAASTPTASELATYDPLPTLGWQWNAGVDCVNITLNKQPCGLEATSGNVCDGGTRGQYTWTAQKCVDNPPLKRYNMQAMTTDFDDMTAKGVRMLNYFKENGGANCTEPGAQTYSTPCVAGQEFQYGALCYDNCPAGKWQNGLSCYNDCPSGRSPDTANLAGGPTNCVDNCGDSAAGTQDYPIVGSGINCKQACSPVDEESGLACYAPCTNGWNRATAVTCNRNSCDPAGTVDGYVDEASPGFCHKKCSSNDSAASTPALTDAANNLNCRKACTFDNNDGANIALANVSPITAPTDIKDCIAWLDATVGFTNGGTVWNSASPSLSYKMTVGGGPSLVANQLFSGSKNVLQLATNQTLSMTPEPVSAAFTMFFVSRQIGPTYGRVFIGNSNNLYGYWGGGKDQLHMDGWLYNSSTRANNTWDSYRIRRAANGSGNFARFGSVLNSFTTTVSSLNGLRVNVGSGGVVANAGCYNETSNAQIAEIIIYNRDLNDTECQQVENYLLAKWFKQRAHVAGLVAKCFKDCDSGWKNSPTLGVGTCIQDSCSAGQWDNGAGAAAVCYDPCPSDKPNPDRAAGTMCYENCPAGTTWDGAATCNSTYRNAMKQDLTTLAAAQVPSISCPSGYHNATTWCQSDTHSCGWNGWASCDNMNPSTTSLRSTCPWNRPNLVSGLCYENCPSSPRQQYMRTLGTCSSDWYCDGNAPYNVSSYCYSYSGGSLKTLSGSSRGSRLKNRSIANANYDDRSLASGNAYARSFRAKEQTIARTQTKTLATKSRGSSLRSYVTQPVKHGVLSTGGCACVIATAWERVNNGCGTFGRSVQYPVAPWGAQPWQVNSSDATVQSLMNKFVDFFVANPSQLPDELFEEDHPLQNQGTPAMDRAPLMKADKTEDITMKSRLVRAYFDYTDALNYQEDIALICSPGYIETLMTDELGEPGIDAPASGNSHLSRARIMYLMTLGANDEDFKSYLTRYDKWKSDTQVAMSERALVSGGTFLDPFSRPFLDKLAQYLFDQTKTLLHGQFFHITNIFGLGYVSESCVELHCNANQYAAPNGTSDAAIPTSLTITPITNWIVRFYLSAGSPVAYEFQNSNANAFMLTNKRCLYYTENYVPVVYFNGYSHTCGGASDLQKQVDYYRTQNNKVDVKYITAQKDITADQTLCAMQWQESDYNPDTNKDGTQMTSKSGAFVWSRNGMSAAPNKNTDGSYDFSTDITTVTNVLLTPSDISTEVFDRINNTDSATEKQSILDGATKAMIPISPPIAVTSKLYRDEEDLEGCYPMKCSNPYIMNLILAKFNGATDPDGGTSKIVNIKKIFTVNSGRCDMLANVISSTGVVQEQARSATMVTLKDAAGAIVPCKYTVSAIGAIGTGTFITDSLTPIPPQTPAMILYNSGYGMLSQATTDSVKGAIDTTRTGVEGAAKTARLKSYAATGFEKKFIDCPAISCSSQDVLNSIVMQYAADNYPKTTTNVLQKKMTKIFKVGTSSSVAGTATCDVNFENTSQFYTSFPGTPAGAANKTTITKRFQVQQSGTCQYTVVSDITNEKSINLPKSSATDLTDAVNVLEDDPSFDKLAIIANKPSTANSMATIVTRDTSGINYTAGCATPVFTNPGILLDIARFITAQNAANSFIVTTLYTPATPLSPTSCSLRVGYTRNGTQTAYMNTFTVTFTKDITACRYRITGLSAGTETAAAAGATALSSFARPLTSCLSVAIPCTSPAVQNEAKSFYKSMMSLLSNGIANTMNITKAASSGTNTCEFEVTTQSGTTTSAWDGTAANFSKFHFTFNFNPDPVCNGINYTAYDMAPVSSSQNSYTVGDKVPENVACYRVLDCNNTTLRVKVTNALNATAPSGTIYSIFAPSVANSPGAPVKTGLNKCEYLVSRTVNGTTTSQDSLGSYDSALHRSVVFKAKTPLVVRTAAMTDAVYTAALTSACYGSTGMDISGTVDPVVQASSRTYISVSCPRIGTTSTSQTVFPHSSINTAIVAALTAKYNEMIATGLFTVFFVKGGLSPITSLNSITVDTTNPTKISVSGVNYQRYEYKVIINVGLSANASRVAAKAPAGNYNITQGDTDYGWNPYLHPVINIFFYNSCTTPVITKDNITFVQSPATSMYRTF